MNYRTIFCYTLREWDSDVEEHWNVIFPDVYGEMCKEEEVDSIILREMLEYDVTSFICFYTGEKRKERGAYGVENTYFGGNELTEEDIILEQAETGKQYTIREWLEYEREKAEKKCGFVMDGIKDHVERLLQDAMTQRMEEEQRE